MALKILLADDSMIAQNLGKKILTDAGHEVVAVSNGAAAVKKIAEMKPDMAILDIYMPGYTGLEVCERIKNTLDTSRMPVLLTVGKMEPYRPEDGARVRAEGVIIKPFEGSDLLAAVNQLAEKLTQPQAVVETATEEPVMEHWGPEPEEPAMVSMPVAHDHDLSLPAFGMDELPVEAPDASMPMIAVAAAAYGTTIPDLSTTDTPAFVIEELPVTPTAPFAFDHALPVELLDSMPTATTNVTDTPQLAEPALAEPTGFAEPAVAFTPMEIESSAFVSAIEGVPDLEFTSAPQIDVQAEASSELEPAIQQEEIQVAETSFAVVPELVTDPTETVTAFPTKFGVENCEEQPAGFISEEPVQAFEPEIVEQPAVMDSPADGTDLELLTIPQGDEFVLPTEEPPAAVESFATAAEAPVEAAPTWQVHEAQVESSEANISLEDEMQRAFASLEDKLETPLMAAQPAVAEIAPDPLMDFAPLSADTPAGPVIEAASFEVPDAFAAPEPFAAPAPYVEEVTPVIEHESIASVDIVEVTPEDEAMLAAEFSAQPVVEVENDTPVELDAPVAQTPEPVVEEKPEAKPEPQPEPEAESVMAAEPLAEIESELIRRAAVIDPSAAVVTTSSDAAPVDEARVSAAVARVMERMKAQIVAEIVKELQSE